MTTFDPTFRDISPIARTAPDVSSWYHQSVIGFVPDTVAPYLAAHGYIVHGGEPLFIEGEFGGWKLHMNRQTFEHADMTHDMLVRMTQAMNEGRRLNDTRYEDLVANFDTLLTNHQTDIEAFIDGSITDSTTGYITLLLADLDKLATGHASFESNLYSYDTGTRDRELSQLKTIWKNAATTLESEYDTMTAGLDIPALIAEVGVSIDALDDALTAFNTEHDGLSATLLSDYNSHATTATAFLTDLGVTELARINEQFDNLKAGNNQNLTDRGFYSSALVTQMEAQVERERSQGIVELNDRLNREKFENQHKLYEQQYQMRLGALEVSYKALEGAALVMNARIKHGEWASKIRHQVAMLSIQAKLELLAVREKYYQFLLSSIDWETNRRIQIYDKLFQSQVEQLRVRQSVGGFHAELIKYQLDSKNTLAQAMFSMVEGREDGYPGFGDQVALVSTLGNVN